MMTALTFSPVLKDANWSELSALYRAAPLGDKAPAWLETAFGNSMFACFVYDAHLLVGAGRALADGVDCSYICDVAVRPDYQGRGIGKQIIANLVARSKGHRKIILYAAPRKEPFYAKLGFRRMKTAMAIFQDQQGATAAGYLHDE